MGVKIPYAEVDPAGDNPFIQALRACTESGCQLTVDETMPDGKTVHSFLRHIASNPVTGATGLAVVVLAITEKK